MSSTRKEDIPTGARATCVWCGLEVTKVQDPYSFAIDYGTDGDYGCGEDPWSDDEGTGGHMPMLGAYGQPFIADPAIAARVRTRGGFRFLTAH